MNRSVFFIIVLALHYPSSAQRYIRADPFYLMYHEKAYFQEGEDHGSLLIRPIFKTGHNPGNNWTFTVRSELFNNTGAPNLENTSDRWIGKGRSLFSSFNISYSGRFLALSFEPFYFRNQNKDFPELLRISQYSRLNDNPIHGDSTYVSSGLREYQIYLHYKGIGFGFSNASMWWGPGMHSSLNMTNNAPGFKHVMIGTVRDIRIGKVSLNIRHIFSEMDGNKNVSEPYYTALVFTVTVLSDPVVTVGLSRAYLTGGKWGEPLTRWEAFKMPYDDPFYLESKQTDPNDPTSSLDVWDQTLSGYLSACFPPAGLKVFIEYGRNDHAWDKKDLRRQPDHSAASVVGLRKYGLFRNEHLTFGIEYANLIQTRYGIGGLRGRKRVPGNWYDHWQYDFSSYDGRHWAAHSGPDSDDFTIYLGYLGDKFSFIPSFNYERHGVIDNRALVWERRPYLYYDPEQHRWVPVIREELRERQLNIWPEVKFEFQLDIRYVYKGFRLNLYYEREFVDNLGFLGDDSTRRGSVIWLGVERRFDDLKLPKILNKL